MKDSDLSLSIGPDSPADDLAENNRWYTEHLALIVSTSKWALLGALTGLLVGFGTKLFLAALQASDHLVARLGSHGLQAYWLLPFALVISVWLVKTFAPDAKGHGTEAVITAVHERDGKVDAKVAPIKLLATVFTIAFGGSVGKEGPCAQIGASITSSVADLMRLNKEDRRRLVICGIGAGFAAVFGTPISGALFGIEVLYLGRIEYQVLFPCLVAGIVAHLVCGVHPPAPALAISGAIGMGQLQLIVWSILFGAICGLTALLLIETMAFFKRAAGRYKKYPYYVALAGGLVLAVVYKIFGAQYSGLGLPTISGAMQGVLPIAVFAFLIKIFVTSLTLETGGSGGIITPLFFIGATLGAGFARIFHLPPALFASFGFIAVVAAAANTPIALCVMGMELLPSEIGVYAALCACTAFLLVGHRSVYSSQRLGFSKTVALEMALNGPIGGLDRSGMTLRPGTLSERIYKAGNRRMGRKPKSVRKDT